MNTKLNRYPSLRSRGVDNPREKILCEDFEVTLSNGKTYTIEKGFVTDLASVPRVLIKKSILLFFGMAFALSVLNVYFAALVFFSFGLFFLIGIFYADRALNDETAFIVHDWLYKNKKFFPRHSRKFVDLQMKYFQEKLGASRPRVFFMFWAVRAGGWIFWNDFFKT